MGSRKNQLNKRMAWKIENTPKHNNYSNFLCLTLIRVEREKENENET